jgi:hypothetical protein
VVTSPILGITQEINDALVEFLLEWDGYTAFDIGPHLSCGEADALARLFRAFEQNDTAGALMESHSVSDDEGDSHFQAQT